MTEPLADTSMDNTATASKPTTSFKRPASPVKFASKKSTKFDDFDDDDDDDDDLFNFDDDDEEPVTSQRKRKRSEDENNVKPCKKINVTVSPTPKSAVEEVPKEPNKKSPTKKHTGFLSKSMQSNSSTATVVKPDIPEEDLTRSFITLEVR